MKMSELCVYEVKDSKMVFPSGSICNLGGRTGRYFGLEPKNGRRGTRTPDPLGVNEVL